MRRLSVLGALYNDVLPLMIKNTEGYVGPLLEGKKLITADAVRKYIADYFKQAIPMAETLGNLDRARDGLHYK